MKTFQTMSQTETKLDFAKNKVCDMTSKCYIVNDLNEKDYMQKTIDNLEQTIKELRLSISSKEKLNFVSNITGNTQISKTELEKLFPININ